jgi:hypothetical protein
LSNLAFNGISLALVIDELLLLGGHQLRIVVRPPISAARDHHCGGACRQPWRIRFCQGSTAL